MADELRAFGQLRWFDAAGSELTPTDACDVAVLGAGPSGAATALALTRAAVGRVVVLERSDCSMRPTGETLPPETRKHLTQLGVWQQFAADGHEPSLGSCSSWGGDGALGFNDGVFNPHGPGWHLDRARFDERLRSAAAAAGVHVRRQTRLLTVAAHAAGGWELTTRDGHGRQMTLGARVVVDASGRAARFGRARGARPQVHDRLTVVTAVLDAPGDAALSRLTALEAVPYGWWYAARTPGDRVVVAVATDAERVRDASLHVSSRWRAALDETRHISRLVPAAAAFTRPELHVRLAPSQVLDRVAGRDWVAVGDAATASDPLMSHGLYHALADATSVVALVTARLGGDTTALAAHHVAVHARFRTYCAQRDALYAAEHRWQDEPFWRRRHAANGTRPGRVPETV